MGFAGAQLILRWHQLLLPVWWQNVGWVEPQAQPTAFLAAAAAR